MVQHVKEQLLIVEDQESVRKACSLVLKNLGYSVYASPDDEDAINYYRNNYKQIDLVLLDLIMPKMSGSECFVELKNINPQIKVIIMSGFTDNGEATKLSNSGSLDFIEKPFTKKIVSKKIKEILNITC